MLLFGMPVVAAGLAALLIRGNGRSGGLSFIAGLIGLGIGIGLVVLGDDAAHRRHPPELV